MKKSNIFLYDDKILINNKIVFREQISSLSIQKKVNIIILDEELYIKTSEIHNKFNISDIIKKSFGNNKDFLFHYFTLNNEILIIYAVKGGEILESLCNNNNIFIKVIPIQIYVLNYLKRKLKKESLSILFSFKDNNYYINYSNGYINRNVVNKNIQEIISNIKDDIVYTDKELELDEHLSFKVNKIDIGEIQNEKNLFKEKFFK